MARLIRAAGGVLWRDGVDGPEVALVHRPRYDDWSLPKGKLRTGEHPLLGAVREVHEETGARGVPGPRLPGAAYRLPNGDNKTVAYWAMRAATTSVFTPDDEVDEVRWLRLADATALTDPVYRPVLASYEALPTVTGTVLLVRHARAGDAQRWRRVDDVRPLDSLGLAQARVLRHVLGAYEPTRILSATPVRCRQTVAPLAVDRGLVVEPDDIFDESVADVDAAAERLADLGAAGGTTVACSQGAVIPGAVARLAELGGLPTSSTTTGKGAWWALSFSGRRLVAADYETTDGMS